MTDTLYLVGNIDAYEWADAFLATDAEHNVSGDRETMMCWFANAIMAGYDRGYERGAEATKTRGGRKLRGFVWLRRKLGRGILGRPQPGNASQTCEVAPRDNT